jgi:hypothetical protein
LTTEVCRTVDVIVAAPLSHFSVKTKETTGVVSLVSPVRSYQWLVTFYTDHFAAFVVAAVWANVVRKPHLTAVGASNKLAGFERVVRPAAVPATF